MLAGAWAVGAWAGKAGVVESSIAEAGKCVDVDVGVDIAVGIGRGGIGSARAFDSGYVCMVRR